MLNYHFSIFEEAPKLVYCPTARNLSPVRLQVTPVRRRRKTSDDHTHLAARISIDYILT